MIWKFDEFVHGVTTDRGIISDDMADAPEAELYVILTEDLGIKPRADWGMPSFKPLSGGIDEIRFKVSNVQYRVFGSSGGGDVYRLWLWATKDRKRKGKEGTEPPNAIEKARERKRQYEIHHQGRLRRYVP